jgi:hypothetical protein
MKTKTRIKAGALVRNHNETFVRDAAKSQGLRVKTHVRAGGPRFNHNETLVRDAGKGTGLKVKTHVRAGGQSITTTRPWCAMSPRARGSR